MRYVLAKRLLTRYYNQLKENLLKHSILENSMSKIYYYIEKYKTLNPEHKYETNTDLVINYFKSVETLETDYWLGWIFAEGHIEVEGKVKKRKVFSVSVGVGDGVLMQRFVEAIGADPRCVEYVRVITKNGKISRSFRLTIRNELFVKYLEDAGVPSGAKSGSIRLPKFNNDMLAKSFLLGVFDGDGDRGDSPKISSKSKEFLLDIKNHFINDLRNKKIGNQKLKGKVVGHYLILSTSLFNSLLDNAKRYGLDSLPRKAVRYLAPSVRIQIRARAIKRFFREKSEERRLKVIELREKGWTDWKKIFTDGLGLVWVSNNRARDYLKNWFSTDHAILGLLRHYPDEDIFVLIEETYGPKDNSNFGRAHIL
jgi:hypothetical protein